jgi:hypothetical protein
LSGLMDSIVAGAAVVGLIPTIMTVSIIAIKDSNNMFFPLTLITSTFYGYSFCQSRW